MDTTEAGDGAQDVDTVGTLKNRLMSVKDSWRREAPYRKQGRYWRINSQRVCPAEGRSEVLQQDAITSVKQPRTVALHPVLLSVTVEKDMQKSKSSKWFYCG